MTCENCGQPTPNKICSYCRVAEGPGLAACEGCLAPINGGLEYCDDCRGDTNA